MTNPTPPLSDTLPVSLEQAILNALSNGGRNRGELSDLTAHPYPTLVPALDSLLAKGAIESYFQTEHSLPVLTYRLRSPAPLPRKLPPPPPPPLPLNRE